VSQGNKLSQQGGTFGGAGRMLDRQLDVHLPSLVISVLMPLSVMFLLWLMVVAVAVKATSQLALNSWSIKIKGCVVSCSTIWPCHAVGGRYDRQSRLASCIEWMMVLKVCEW